MANFTAMQHIREQFLLNPEVIHLNHGSFGACPKPIFEDYQHWQLELEKNTVRFFVREAPELLRRSREALGTFIGCHEDDVVLMTNPSYALNMVIRSLRLKEGDEILTTDLEYGAMDRTWNYYCREWGAKYVRQPIKLPVTTEDAIIEQLFDGLTERTRVLFISHMTSTTALRLPVERICRKAKEHGLITIVDGAHAPGHLPLDLSEMEADIYAGACHKWLLTPKGCSFLYVKKALQPMDPIIISWGYESDQPSHSQFIDHHQLQGTRDVAAFLTIPAALQFRTDNDWNAVGSNCMKLAWSHYEAVAEACGGTILCPIDDRFLGQMCSMAINCPDPQALQALLYDRYAIEAPVMPHGENVFLRYCVNGYNTEEELNRLTASLKDIRSTTDLLADVEKHPLR